MKRNIYRVWLNADTMNFGGLEWVVDGEDGYRNYPGTWAENLAWAFYERGLDFGAPVPKDLKLTGNESRDARRA